MEGRFDTNDFENLLREQADRFYLVPSERVWKGIYNGLRPGSKWPSLGMGLVILISLVWIGSSHQSAVTENAITKTTTEVSTVQVAPPSLEPTIPLFSDGNLQSSTDNTATEVKVVELKSAARVTTPVAATIPAKTPATSVQVQNTVEIPSLPVEAIIIEEAGEATEILVEKADFTQPVKAEIEEADVQIEQRDMPVIPVKGVIPVLGTDKINSELQTDGLTEEILPELSDLKRQEFVDIIAQSAALEETLAAVAGDNKKLRKAQWEFFVTPTVSTVSLNRKDIKTPPVQNLMGNSAAMTPVREMHSRSLAGVQVGANALYRVNDAVNFRTGAQITYSGYKIKADFVHPTFASVTFVDGNGELYNKSYMTYYGNKGNAGKVNIDNYSLIVSVPFGLDWTIYENDNVQIILMSSVEPLALVKGNAYILSGDGRNFVEDRDLLRRFNVNGNFGSMISFNTSKVNWKMGPVFSYQVLSSYQNAYPTKEHLVNYGFRLGIGKSH